jgi:hypothetical protein
MAKVTASREDNDQAIVSYTSRRPIVKAEFNYTLSTGPWQERNWSTIEAVLDTSRQEARATLPKDTKVYYFNIIDDSGNIVSSEHVEK